MKNAFLTTIPKMIQQKNQKKLPGRPKKNKKEKFFAKKFFQLAIWKQIVLIWQQFCKISAANPKFSRPRSVIISISQ